MAGHPFRSHRAHLKERSRVSHIAGGGGHADAAEDRAMIGKAIKSHEQKMHHALGGQHMDGGEAKMRGDKPHRAHGGRVKKKARGGNTHVNIMVGQPHAGGPPMGPGGPPPMPPPHPPMMPPPGPPGGPPPGMGAGPPPMLPGPGGAPPMGPGGIPPALAAALAGGGARPPAAGLPPGVGGPGMLRRDGGGTYKRGGAVKRAAGGYTPTNKGTKVFREGLASGTHIQHQDGKDDQADQNRGKPITYKRGGKIHRATGGPVEAPEKPAKVREVHLPSGSGGGEARLAKEKMARKSYKAPPPSYDEGD